MKRWARVSLCSLILAAAAAVSSGVTSAATPGVLDASFSLDVQVPATALQPFYQVTSQEVPGSGTRVPTSSCGRDHFTLNGTANWFRFHEEQTENGCGESLFFLPLPPGTRAVDVQFMADRIIRQTSQLDLPKSMEQQLRIYDQKRSVVATFDYFDRSSAEHEARLPFQFQVAVQPDQQNVTLGWRFGDVGQTFGQAAVNPLFGQAFSSTVTEARVVLLGIPATIENVRQERVGVQEGSVQSTTMVEVVVPSTLGGVSGRLSLHVRVTSDLAFSHVVGPAGETLPARYLASSEAGGAREVVITGNATALYGPGLYRIVFSSATTLYSSPGSYAFALVILAIPAAAGLLAVRNARAFRRQATPQFAITAATLDRVVIAMLAAYVVLPITVIAGSRLPLLTTVPLNNEAGLVYFLIVFAFAGFVIVGFVGRRQLSSIMRAEAASEERARQELQRSNRELEEFAYVASHDLQEPLRAVASYTQLLQRRYKGKLDADADTYIENAVSGAARMQGLIKDLLEYSRVGAQPGPVENVALPTVLAHVKADLAPAISDAGAEVHIGALPTVRGHERELRQVFQNLIGNALKFRDPKRPSRINVEATRDGDAWRFAVRDNGIGLEMKHDKLIFQIFQQLHGRNEYAGNGIGLAICKRIVELKHGQIGVDSTIGKGSTFWFTWPDENVAASSRTGAT